MILNRDKNGIKLAKRDLLFNTNDAKMHFITRMTIYCLRKTQAPLNVKTQKKML